MSVVHFPAHLMQNVESCSWKILETCTELLTSISIWQQEYDAWFPATCERVLSTMMFRICTWLYRFLIFAPLHPLIIRVVLPVLHGGPKKSPRALIIPIPRIVCTISFHWISFAPVFSFIYCESLSLLYLLIISWFICSGRWCTDQLGVFHDNQISMCLDLHLN